MGTVVVFPLEEKQIEDTRQSNNVLKSKKRRTCPPQRTGKITSSSLEIEIYFTDGSLTANRTVTKDTDQQCHFGVERRLHICRRNFFQQG